jgi:hypothetical protein
MINKYNFFIFYFFALICSSYVSSTSYNTIGQTGIINTPSADIHESQSVYFTFKRNDYLKLGTITVTPFDWLEASYFYYRPDDLLWGSSKGLYLDKGFNIKFSHKPNNIIFPRFAIGLDDFAGTGQFSREYVVATYDFNGLKLTSGIGWGKFVGESSFQNPLSYVSDIFSNRKIEVSDQGGQVSFSQWFRGPSTHLLGLEYKLAKIKNLSIKIERDPFDYFQFGCCGEGKTPESFLVRNKDSDINFGLSYKYKEFGNINLSYVKGNTWSLSFSVGFNGKKNYRVKPKFTPSIDNRDYQQEIPKNEFYLDLLNNLNENKLYLQTANIENSTLNLSIESAEHFNPIVYSSRAAYVANEVSKLNNIKLKKIEVGHISRDFKINSISYLPKDLNQVNRMPNVIIKRNSLVTNSLNDSHKNHEFRPTVKFPVVINQFSPDIKTHVGSPEKFLYVGLGIKATTEIQFNRNLVFYSVIGKSFKDNFDKKVSIPNSQLANVRTQVVDYLQGSSKDVYITNMSIENIWSPYNNLYAKVSMGYLESMYGGVSTEMMFKPFKSNFAFSIEYNNVKKRSFDQKFSFANYRVSTTHLNVAHYHPQSNILAKWSYGKYLAQDKGYTLDISRRLPSGWQAGIWFSNTNVSAEQFGEGSFDKGFYINIPLNLFSKNYVKNIQGFGLRTMTRDGAQKLELRNRLIDSFYGSSYNEINENWNGFLN